MKSIFLCHSHADKDFARRLATDLDSLSVPVWLDEWELRVGDSLHTCIGKALCESAFVGVILSPDSIASRWCRSELDQALSQEKRTGATLVLPLLCRPVLPPPFLEGRLYLSFYESYFASLCHLAALSEGLNIKPLYKRLATEPPRSINDAQQLLTLTRASGETLRIMPAVDYHAIQSILKRNQLDIPDSHFLLKSPNHENHMIVLDDCHVHLENHYCRHILYDQHGHMLTPPQSEPNELA